MTDVAQLIRDANQSLLNEGALDKIPDYFNEDYVAHLTGKDMSGGHKAITKTLEALRHSFPDLQVEVEILVESELRVAWQRTYTATHTESFKGFPGTGKQIQWRDMVTSEIRDGRISQEWVLTDLAEQLLLARKK